jgi:hypothetical protein
MAERWGERIYARPFWRLHPARKCDDKRAKQPVAAENRRLTHTTDPHTISFAEFGGHSPAGGEKAAERLPRDHPN